MNDAIHRTYSGQSQKMKLKCTSLKNKEKMVNPSSYDNCNCDLKILFIKSLPYQHLLPLKKIYADALVKTNTVIINKHSPT